MTHALLKLSYNNVGESPITGGICGSAFFINPHKAITAHHILSTESFKPNDGFRKCQYWLLSRDGLIIEFDIDQLSDFPEIDTTSIDFDISPDGAEPMQVLNISTRAGEGIINEGYISNNMPQIRSSWSEESLIIHSCNLASVIADAEGTIIRVCNSNVNSNDVNIDNIETIITSYPGRVGMSGGPMIRRSTGEVIGLMSFGLPPDSVIKTNLAAISISEILSVINID